MVYKRFIKREVNGKVKTFGPYYYESYRDKHGVARTKYVHSHKVKRAVTKKIHSYSVFRKHTTLFILRQTKN